MSEKVKNGILPFVFILFIFSFAIMLAALPKKNFSETEKRVLAKFPKADFESVENGEFTDGLEKYLSDHLRALFSVKRAKTEFTKQKTAILLPRRQNTMKEER